MKGPRCERSQETLLAIQLHLASRSPRRAELLRQLGVRFDVLVANVDETPLADQSPDEYALAVALAKAQAPLCPDRLPVVGGDTVVAIDGQILGKPRDRAHALEMLARLSGRTHKVYSAVAVAAQSGSVIVSDAMLSVTRVRFGRIRRAEALAYWETGEPTDKAGAYAIQGRAGRWVREIRGSYSGVVGLPLYETGQLLTRFCVELPN